MQFSAAELAKILDHIGEPPRIVLINGNEALLVEEALTALRETLKQQGFSERLSYQVDANFDWGRVFDSNSTLSLFSERRMLECRVLKSLGTKGSKALLEYCDQDQAGDDVLVVLMPLLDKRQRQSKWYGAVNQAGWVIDCHDIGLQQLPGWLKQRFQSRALRVENGVIDVMVEKLEGNLFAAAQEVDRLQVLAPDGAVTLSLLTQSLSDQARFDVFELSDACLLGDAPRATRILQRLQAESIEPVVVIWALVREIRAQSQIGQALSEGQNATAVYRTHRVWKKREPMVNAAQHRLDSATWHVLLQQAMKIDQMIKGHRFDLVGDAWYQLTLLCEAMCDVKVIECA